MTELDALPPWHLACRADVPIAPDTIAGILDGDGCLTLVRRGTRPIPVVALGMRDDDPTPVAVARSLAAYVGRPVGHVTHRQRTLTWRATANADLVLLTRFLARHPLRSPRGVAHLEAVTEATAILRSAQARGGTHAPLGPREAERLEELWGSVGRRADIHADAVVPGGPEGDAAFGPWFAGLVAAEGHFGASSARGERPRPVFGLTQRDDNRPLLVHVQERLGMGRIQAMTPGIGRPASNFAVNRLDDLERLVSLLRDHPLPEASPKAPQFEVWAELVALARSRFRRHQALDGSTDTAIGIAARRLFELRAYAGPEHICSCPPR